MTLQEAINNLNDLIDERKSLISGDKDYDEIFQDDIKTLEIAKQALEKQMPKKPVKSDRQEIRYSLAYDCPACGKKFTGTGIADYCYHCGQALDWSDEE